MPDNPESGKRISIKLKNRRESRMSHPARVSSSRLEKKRIVLTTVGSMGDVHPYFAIALGLKARGLEAVVATCECYRGKVEGLGLGFRALRPDFGLVSNPEAMGRLMDLRQGTRRVLCDVILPSVRDSYEDTMDAATGADLLVSHPICFATRLVAEKRGIPWVSTMISPVGLFSAYDPPMLPGMPEINRAFGFLGPGFWGPLGRFLKRATRSWARPLIRFRAELGLPPAEGNPLVDGHSPALVLALFSSRLAGMQRDWPAQTRITGFPLHDGDVAGELPPELARFLDDGPPPIVFTLGGSSSFVIGPFYEASALAAKAMGRRAVIILTEARNRPASLPDGVVAFDYAPFSALFPRAAAVVHHGGIGTSGLAMQAGRPMLVVPFAHDQPDTAERLARLGIARTIPSRRYRPDRVVAELGRILDDPGYSRRASEVAEHVRGEDGVRVACDALERLLQTGRPAYPGI
jgi:rhamnosyltransferase subunit B